MTCNDKNDVRQGDAPDDPLHPEPAPRVDGHDRAARAQAATPKTGGTLRISRSTRIATLNVLSMSGPAEYPVIDMICSGLTRIGLDGKAHPDLATRVEASADATECTYFLRAGVAFRDGAPFTAEDVIATCNAILIPDVPAAAQSVPGTVERVEAVDPLAVKFS